MTNYKRFFPIFENSKDLVYLDNASTTQKPNQVLNKLIEYYSTFNANVHRGLYPLSEKSTDMYEDARKTLADFINAKHSEVIFTSGTTDSLNSIALSLVKSGLIRKDFSVLLTELDHHSNILPWQVLNPARTDFIFLNKEGFTLNYESIDTSINYDVVAVPYISNVTGEIVDIKKLRNIFPKSIIVVDAAQAIAHKKVDVKDLDVDFLTFSGHKMYGPTGVGVLYGKKEMLEKLQPFKVGGGMIMEVKRDSSTWAPIPNKFEAGTPPIAEAIALAEAAKFIKSIGFDNIHHNEKLLKSLAVEELKEIKDISIFHPTSDQATGVISFNIDSIHAHDIAGYLGERNICIRAGHHCTQILHKEVFNIPASSRISFGIYNTIEDVEAFVEGLEEAIKYYG